MKNTLLLISTFIMAVLACHVTPKALLAQKIHLSPISKDVTISVSIGEPKLKLFGYSPANGNVFLNGIGISSQTISKADGYYEFSDVFLPVDSAEEITQKLYYPEICLLAIDRIGLTTQPTCIPPLPFGYFQYEIGPVLLSPTFNIEKGISYKGDTTKASGITTPNTEVSVFLAQGRSKFLDLSIVKQVSAYYIPTYHITSNNIGYFEFNVPTDSTNKWNVYVASNILNANSPKSTTLTHNVLPWYYYFIQLLLMIFKLLRPYLYLIIIILQILIIILLIRHFRRISERKKHQIK